MSTYDQIMAYYADDEEFQKRAQTRWKYFEREGYRKLSDILPVYDYADKVEKIRTLLLFGKRNNLTLCYNSSINQGN